MSKRNAYYRHLFGVQVFTFILALLIICGYIVPVVCAMSTNQDVNVEDVDETISATTTTTTTNKTTTTQTSTDVSKVDERPIDIAMPIISNFKSYMSYKAITDRTTKQWALQQDAVTNSDGLRCIGDIPLVAIGTGWSIAVGDMATVHLDNGNTFDIIVGDIKDDKHTDSTHKVTIVNGCATEFIVDIYMLPRYARISGSISAIDKYNGAVVNITKK